jgi:acetoin utilization protein AcuC
MATRESAPDPRPILVHGPWSPRYDLGPAHPLTPRRFGPGIDLLTAVSGGPPRLLEPEPASDEALRAIHAADYIRTVRRFGTTPFGAAEAGIGPGDTPAFSGMHEAAGAVAGGSLQAMEMILVGEASHAFHPGGGLHHAMRDRAAGFCIYNDPALAIRRARAVGLRVLYVDLDVHHGDGVQAIHADDPGVLTFSIHQSGRTLFPGTGSVGELGEGAAAGTVLNLPLDPGTGERGWLGALRMILPEIAAAFGPEVVVSQHGADAHAWDPLANLRVTTTAMGEAARLVDTIAHRWAGGRWLATGGGGYDAYRVVPRAWSLVWLAALHAEWRLPVPAAWRERWDAEAARYGSTPLPVWLEDEANAGLRADATQDLADRRAVETAMLLRELTVPALLRAATDLGWWRAADDLAREGRVAAPGSGDAPMPSSPTAGSPRIVASVDAGTWERFDLATGVLPLADARAAHALALAALRSPDAVAVTAAIVGSSIVGAAVSCAPAGDVGAPRLLLSVGVACDWRRRGLAAELLGEHLRAVTTASGWSAAVTLAERDPLDPLPRPVRAAIARRLLEGAGFQVEAAAGLVGGADRAALVARQA